MSSARLPSPKCLSFLDRRVRENAIHICDLLGATAKARTPLSVDGFRMKPRHFRQRRYYELSLLIQKIHPRTRSIRLHRRLIHQLRARWSDSKLAWHLHSQRDLKHRVAVEIVHKQRRLLIAELARAVPVGPSTRTGISHVSQIDPADSIDLFASGGNRIF